MCFPRNGYRLVKTCFSSKDHKRIQNHAIVDDIQKIKRHPKSVTIAKSTNKISKYQNIKILVTLNSGISLCSSDIWTPHYWALKSETFFFAYSKRQSYIYNNIILTICLI